MKTGIRNVLLLNSTYEPIKILNWKRAVTLYFKGKVEVLSDYQIPIRAENFIFQLPSVIKLINYVRINYFSKVKFSKNNIFLRDGYRCAYCGNIFNRNELTLDHIVPSSKGGKKSWQNIITACKKCNNKKGNNTPEQAGMKLHYNAKKPSSIPHTSFIHNLKNVPRDWKPYLFY